MSEQDDVLAGGGELGARIREIDWSTTALAAVSTWPQSLRSALSICLGSRFPIAIYWGPELVLLYNDAWSPILGEKHPSALGRPGREVWPEIWDTIGPMFEQVMATGEATYAEDSLLLMHRHGYTEECYFNFTFSPVRGERGRVEGIFNAVIETTYRVLAERRTRVLRDLGERVALTTSTDDLARAAVASLGTAETDVTFCMLYLADQTRALATLAASAGVTAGSAIAPSTVPLHSDESPWPFHSAEQARRALVVRGLTDRFGSAPLGGAWPEPTSSAFVVPIAHPSFERAFGFLVLGVSPRRSIDDPYLEFAEKAGSQLAASFASARRQEEITAIDRAKTAFFSSVSHEFRTPLTLMLAPIDDLRSLPTSDPETRQRVELLHRNALRLLKLVNNLLDFSRIEAGRVEASYQATDLAALTADLASTFRSTIERAGLSFVVECETVDEEVFVDREMWEKIVLNLLSNAFKFTFDGSIGVRLRKTEGGVELEIRDTGTGIAEAELPRLFERFHRIEGARSRSHEGSGIGLALVHELIRMHGGEIRAESRPGLGTTFFVRVPLGTKHLAPDRIRQSEQARPLAAAAAFVQEASRWVSKGSESKGSESTRPPALHAGPEGRRARIILADDNADMRDYLSRLLGEHWDVEAVTNGHAALTAIRRDPPALVISDVMMPGLDGFGLLRALRNDAVLAATPFVLLSARAGEEAATEGLRAGADDYITKPFSARELLVRVTARLSAAKASSEAEEQRNNLYHVLNQAPFPLAVFRGPDHVVELANEAMGEQWGKGPHVVGLPLVEAVPELAGQPFLPLLDEVYRSGIAHQGRAELARLGTGPNGALEDHYFNYVYAPLLGGQGQIEGVMACAFDVTESVHSRRELERVSRAKDEFLATMSHELRTPLNAMLGWSKLLLADSRDPATVERGLAVIERNARAQARLVDDLMDVSRIVSGKLQLNMKKTQISNVIHAASDVVRATAETKGVRLVVDLDPEVGATVADSDRLQQVIWNLLSNAVRFTPAKGRVLVTAQRTASTITIVVEDTGAGIAPEHLPHVFERFRQVDSSTTRAHGGLGLGLAIVRHLVEAHGGGVSASSPGLGLGARFTVALPISAVSVPEGTFGHGPRVSAHDSQEAEIPPERRSRLDDIRVLVVEDELDSRELLRLVLETAGARVTAAASAREALEASGPFDIVVSDIGMPEMDGYALLNRIRARPADARVPALALTAYARSEDAERSARAGYQEHITKPVDASVLLDAIRKWTRASPDSNAEPFASFGSA